VAAVMGAAPQSRSASSMIIRVLVSSLARKRP
jgi:hypothetical protein